MSELLQQYDRSLIQQLEDGVIHTDCEKSGWESFSPEVGFFLVDFYKNKLTPIQKLIFYAYYINGMTMKDIADRLYSPEQQDQLEHEDENEEDDNKIDADNFHSSHQSVYHHIRKIEKKLHNCWNETGTWKDTITTKKVKGKNIKIFNPNKGKKNDN